MSKQILRVKSDWGQQRIEIDPNTTTFVELLNKIAFNIGRKATDISIHAERRTTPAINVPEKTIVSRIPSLRENGVEIFVKEKAGAVNTNTGLANESNQTQYKPSKQCNHGPSQRCVNCEQVGKTVEEKKKKCLHGPKERCINCLGGAEKKKGDMEIEESKENKGQENNSKCTHGPGGKCINCIVIEKDKDKLKQGMKQNCQHGPNGKCVHCLGSEFIASAKHISFDQFWHDRTLKCKNTHPPHEQCPHCTPIPNMSYVVKKNCKEHQPFPVGMCAKCLPPAISLKRQIYRHIDFCSIMNVKEIGGLVTHWIKQDFQEQRFGWLYGYYAEDFSYPLGIRAVVECVYEPKQVGDVSGFSILEDRHKENADRIATALGFELIGQIFTSINHDVPLSSAEIRQAARYQQEYRVDHQTGYQVSKFITCVLRTGKQNPSDVAPEVYMVSDEATDMERDNIFAEIDGRKVLKVRKPKDANDIIPTILEESKTTTEMDPSWFIVNIGVGNMPDTRYNVLKHSEFPVSNRQENEQTPQMVKKFLSRFKNDPSHIRFADFHLLLYLSKLIDIDTAVTIAQYVGEEKEIPKQTVEFVDTMLSQYH